MYTYLAHGEKMFKKLPYIISILFVLFTTACTLNNDSSDNEQKYYVEMGRITKTDYNTCLNTYRNLSNSPTAAEIKAVRSTLRSYQQYDFSSTAICRRSEFHAFLTEHGYSKSEADETIKAIDSVGNNILFFHYKYSDDYVCWMYVEKE